MTPMKNLQNQQEFALREEIGFTGLPDQFRDFAHGLVHGQIAQLIVGKQAEQQAQRADAQSAHQQGAAVDAHESGLAKVGQDEVGFPTALWWRILRKSDAPAPSAGRRQPRGVAESRLRRRKRFDCK